MEHEHDELRKTIRNLRCWIRVAGSLLPESQQSSVAKILADTDA